MCLNRVKVSSYGLFYYTKTSFVSFRYENIWFIALIKVLNNLHAYKQKFTSACIKFWAKYVLNLSQYQNPVVLTCLSEDPSFGNFNNDGVSDHFDYSKLEFMYCLVKMQKYGSKMCRLSHVIAIGQVFRSSVSVNTKILPYIKIYHKIEHLFHIFCPLLWYF